jgi:monoterpene epsilon-lactone hydrolase
MPICDRSRIRPDVLGLMRARMKEQMKGVFEFLKAKEDWGVDFQALYQKMTGGNELLFKRKGGQTIDDLRGYIGKDEMLFLAKASRSGFDYAANSEQKRHPLPTNVRVEPISAGGVSAEWQTIPDATEDRVLLYVHGAGFIMGSANSFRGLTFKLGELTKMRVLSLNYRLAPEHSYPAQLEDCSAAYRWLLSTGIKPGDVVIAGDSAGGNLALEMLLKSRSDGVPLPAGAVCLSPLVDCGMRASDDPFWENAATDPVLAETGIFYWMAAYLGEADPGDPLVSPIYAELGDLPPLLVQASTCEMLFNDSKRLVDKARAAGTNATLQSWDDMMHAFQYFGLHDLPEAGEALDNIAKFVKNLFK